MRWMLQVMRLLLVLLLLLMLLFEMLVQMRRRWRGWRLRLGHRYSWRSVCSSRGRSAWFASRPMCCHDQTDEMAIRSWILCEQRHLGGKEGAMEPTKRGSANISGDTVYILLTTVKGKNNGSTVP